MRPMEGRKMPGQKCDRPLNLPPALPLMIAACYLLSACNRQPQSDQSSSQAGAAKTVSSMTKSPPTVPSRNTEARLPPLLSAARDGKTADLHAQLANGALPNQIGPGGETALHWAAAYGQLDAARELLNAGALTTNKTLGGLTPLHWAAQEGQTSVGEILLSKGADPNAVTDDKSTPLHLAAAHGHIDMIRILLVAKVSPNVADDSGATPLHLAAAYGQVDAVKELLGRGADPGAVDADGLTPYDLAVVNEHDEAADLLEPKKPTNAPIPVPRTP
jgi:ankyrin repeat protein